MQVKDKDRGVTLVMKRLFGWAEALKAENRVNVSSLCERSAEPCIGWISKKPLRPPVFGVFPPSLSQCHTQDA